MKEFIEYIIKNIVSQPDSVDIRVKEGDQRSLVEIRVALEDIGKVVGKKGRVIHSLRTIAISIGMRLGQRVQIEVIQDDEPQEKKETEVKEVEAPKSEPEDAAEVKDQEPEDAESSGDPEAKVKEPAGATSE